MPISKTLITTWVCNMCGRGETHTAGTGSSMSAEHFVDRLGWRLIDGDLVVCDRCRNYPEVVNAELNDRKAHAL